MAHDEHFLERLDRVARQHVELALGLYRDHELVAAILSDTRLPPDAARVALALEDGGDGPHLVVARDGAFVTCLGKGMRTGALPVISRAHLDGLAARVGRVREGLALAKKRGLDESGLLERLETAGSSVSREDFRGASAMLGPAVPLLMGTYTSWATALDEMYPLLLSAARGDPVRRRPAERSLASGAWAMSHAAMVLVDSASRDWVRDWAALPAHDEFSPWGFLTMTSALPFVVRAAWLAGRLGKPMFASYKTRFARARSSIDLREAGWGLACMGLRHAALRGEAMRTLRSPPPHGGREPWVAQGYSFFEEAVRILEEKEEILRVEGFDLGRDFVVIRTENLPESSRYRFTRRDDVPGELALPGLFDAWYDANNGESGADMMLRGIVAASHARAEDFYFPAPVLHAIGPPDLESMGSSLVEMRRLLVGVPRTLRHGERPGRNDPCHCGSGKKFKKCHGR
ncbi:MAG TPA: SEC-C domain-containing protein [Polyangiaceae bacterium]|nr:SEC-C domain-containing protein [Polyangiaceae bacterium]